MSQFAVPSNNQKPVSTRHSQLPWAPEEPSRAGRGTQENAPWQPPPRLWPGELAKAGRAFCPNRRTEAAQRSGTLSVGRQKEKRFNSDAAAAAAAATTTLLYATLVEISILSFRDAHGMPGLRLSSQVKLLLPKFHRNRTRKYNNTALFLGGCWVPLTGRFHRHSAAGWAGCKVAGPGRVRRRAAQFSERSSTPLMGHARVALSGMLITFLWLPACL